MRRLGRIKLSQALLLRWLDFPDAIIRDVQYDINSQTIDIILESTEMPKVKKGDVIPTINPQYVFIDGRNERIKDERKDK